ncbi:MAG TPA: serine hydrolase [Candidatus Kapabacteria bacterium]|nr:serine hydrolase [Candidatus Kapabacteria bacterium]
MNQLFWESRRVENFRHMDRLFPAHPLAASTTPHVFPRAEMPAPLPTTYIFNDSHRLTEAFLEKTRTTGLLVLRDGVILHEEYRRDANASSTLTSWSMAKSVVATLVAIALKEGTLHSLDDTVGQYVPELKNSAWAPVRIRDLLRMASGIRFDETYDNRLADIHRIFYKTFIFNRSIDSAVAGYPAEDVPGTRFHYKSVDTQVLSLVLRRATGRPLTTYAQEKLWQPLGMQDTGFWNTDFHGNELGYCCLNISLRDYAKLGQLYLQQGQWNGQQLLPADWVREATKRPEPWLAAGNGYAERGYGYHWWVPRDPDQEFFANGVWGQTIFVDEKTRTVIVKTSVDPNFKANTAEMIAFMRGMVKGLTPTPP